MKAPHADFCIAAAIVPMFAAREMLKRNGLIHADSQFPPSLTLLVEIALLGIGIAAILSMATGMGPLQ
jgi:hypothetical protein